MNKSRKYQHWAVALAIVAVSVVVVAGCAEKITGPGQSDRVSVNMTFKAGPAVQFRLTVSAADMDTIRALMGPSDSELVTVVEVPLGVDRRFLVEGLDLEGVVMYSGEEVHDVTALLPLDLSIDMPPVAPMLYLNPHFATVEVGREFVLTVCVNDLVGLTSAGFGISLGDNGSLGKLLDAAVIDTVILDERLVELGIGLNFSRDSATAAFISVQSEGQAIVDEQGDGCLVEIHCSAQDLWTDEPFDLIPTLFLENLNGIDLQLGDVHLDTARMRLVRESGPESYLGTAGIEAGVAMVDLGGGDVMLAGLTLTGDPGGRVFEYFLSVARLDQNLQPEMEELLPWSGEQTTAGLARSSVGFYGLGNNSQVGGEVIHFNEQGGEIWRSELGGNRQMFDIAPRPGGGSIVSGSHSSDGNHFFLAALAENGSFVAFAPTNFSADEEYRAVVAFDDGTVAAAGTSRPFSANVQTLAVGRYTVGGEIAPVWEREFFSNDDRMAHDLLVTSDGGLLVVGRTGALVGGPYDVLAVKLDQDGFIEWERSFAALGNDVGQAVTTARDGSYVITGSTTAAGSSARDVVVVKVSPAGELIWQRVLGGPEDDLAMDIIPRGDGFLVTGLANPGPFGSSDILMLRLDREGR